MIHGLILAAASEAPSSTASVIAVFLQYGAVGAMLVVVSYALWRGFQREQKRGDRLEEALAKKNAEMQDSLKLVMGPIQQMTELIKIMIDKSAQMQAIIDLYERQKRNGG